MTTGRRIVLPTKPNKELIPMIEAICDRCGETFVPHSDHPDDLIHGERSTDEDWEAGRECGGVGIIVGEVHYP